MVSSSDQFDVFLKPGEFGVFADGERVKTVLGTCVAICLWDTRQCVGGINHFLLPHPAGNSVPSARFGTVACTELIQQMYSKGAKSVTLKAAVIGGGAPVRSLRGTAGKEIGDENTRVALDILAEHKIVVGRQETGGDHGRALLFHTRDGRLRVDTLDGQWRHCSEGGRN